MDIWTAVKESDEVELARLLAGDPAQASVTDCKGRTPLMMASMYGKLGMVQSLLQHGAGQGLEKTDGEGDTALHHAARGGHEEVVTHLLGQGAGANITDGEGVTPLIEASMLGRLGAVKVLAQHMEGQQGLDTVDKQGRTALFYAVSRQRMLVMAQLLRYGAQANIATKEGKTPLMATCETSNSFYVKMILHCLSFAWLFERDGGERTALHFAAARGDEAMVEVLLREGAEGGLWVWGLADDQGRTPLIIASSRGALAMVQMLVEYMKGWGWEAAGGQGSRALRQACEGRHVEVVHFLRDQGCMLPM